jgi:hypothetical protein
MARSALWPIVVGLVAAIEGSSALAALLAGDMVYSPQPPERTPLDYITVTQPTELPDNVFGARGTAASFQIDIWTKNLLELGNSKQLAIYDELYALLHEKALAMTGFRIVVGTLTLITILPDVDGLTLHGVARYDVIQREA